MWVLKGAGLIIGVYAIVRLGGLGIAWMKEGLDELSPKKRRYKHKYYED